MEGNDAGLLATLARNKFATAVLTLLCVAAAVYMWWSSAASASAATRTLAAFDKSSPLAVALMRKGLTEQQIMQDGWTVLMSLPADVVDAVVFPPPATAQSSLEKHVSLDVLKVKPLSALSCEVWCIVVTGFAAVGPKGGRLLGSVAVRDALVALSTLATSSSACAAWCGAVARIISVTEANKQLFCTAAVRDAMVALSAQATTAVACRNWFATLLGFTSGDGVVFPAGVQLFGAEAVRDALVTLVTRVPTAEACKLFCSAIFIFSTNEIAEITDRQQRFGTPEVRDALVAASHLLSDEISCRTWCLAVKYLASSTAGRRLFGTAEVRDALVAVRVHARTPGACVDWCTAVSRLRPECIGLSASSSVDAGLVVYRRLFCTTAVRDALVALRPQATTIEAFHAWCVVIVGLAVFNAASQQVFNTAAVRDALVGPQAIMAGATSEGDATAGAWCAIVGSLLTANWPANTGALFRVDGLRNTHAALRRFVTTHATQQMWHTVGALLAAAA